MPVSVKLYALPGSHPCAAVEVALQLKGIEHQRVDMLPLQQLLAGPLLYRGITVPGMRIDGERIVGSRTIMRRLDELAAEPAMLPTDVAQRARVLELELWGDEVLQPIPRHVMYASFLRRPRTMESYAEQARLPLPLWAMRPMMWPTSRLLALRGRIHDRVIAADLAALPGHIERIDAWIGEGIIGGETPNAADLQIGSSIRLLNTVADLQPLIADRPAATLMRYFPPQTGSVPAGTLPAELLPH
ncbi:MAG TPA: glutathione S-transferase N-terminal domain-containing protein [Solirubrobacteraceae bacterium]|jgi:glutathione S-transferase